MDKLTRISSVLIFLTIVFMVLGWYYYKTQGGPGIPFDGINHGIIALIGIYAFGRLWKGYQKTKNLNQKYLSYYIFGWVVAGATVALTSLYFFDNALLLGMSYLIATVSVTWGTAYFLRIPFSINNLPLWEKLIFWGWLVFGGLLIVGSTVIYFPKTYVNESGFLIYNTHPFLGPLSYLFYSLIMGSVASYFFYQAARAKEKIVRIRAVCVGIGSFSSVGLIFRIFGGGPLASLGEFIVAIGFLFFLAGFLYETKSARA